MKKDTVKSNINALKKMSSKMPKTINEAINFQDIETESDEMDSMENDDMPVEPAEKHIQHQEESDGEMDVMAFVDDIRKKALKGMAALADNPDSEKYILLKKIWQICDKKPEQQTLFSSQQNQGQQNQF